MTPKQIQAINNLKVALNACHDVELSGWVYDCAFGVYPSGKNPVDPGYDGFFEWIEEHGEIVYSSMCLDGGPWA